MNDYKIIKTERILRKIELPEDADLQEDYWRGYRDCLVEMRAAIDTEEQDSFAEYYMNRNYRTLQRKAETAISYIDDIVRDLRESQKYLSKIVKGKQARK